MYFTHTRIYILVLLNVIILLISYILYSTRWKYNIWPYLSKKFTENTSLYEISNYFNKCSQTDWNIFSLINVSIKNNFVWQCGIV